MCLGAIHAGSRPQRANRPPLHVETSISLFGFSENEVVSSPLAASRSYIHVVLWCVAMMARSMIARCGISLAILAVRAHGEVVDITGEVREGVVLNSSLPARMDFGADKRPTATLLLCSDAVR